MGPFAVLVVGQLYRPVTTLFLNAGSPPIVPGGPVKFAYLGLDGGSFATQILFEVIPSSPWDLIVQSPILLLHKLLKIVGEPGEKDAGNPPVRVNVGDVTELAGETINTLCSVKLSATEHAAGLHTNSLGDERRGNK